MWEMREKQREIERAIKEKKDAEEIANRERERRDM
jgi:hypothetical protein